MLGMDALSIGGIEKGKAFPSIPIMLYIMENFHISPLWIISGEGEMFLTGELEEKSIHKIQEIYPDIPDDERTKEFLFWLQDDFVRHSLIKEFLEMKKVKYPDYFEKIQKTLGKNKK